MAATSRILIHGAMRPGRSEADFWVVVEPPLIVGTGYGVPPEGNFSRIIDARGALMLPGAIDCHVHFREPGMTHKATIASESRAAVAGGVTSFIEMPNTRPATTTIPLWQQKCDIAKADSPANYAFFLGATADNNDVLLTADYSRIPGVKVFMGSSTGSLLVDDNNLLCRIMRDVPALIAVHAEDNDRISRRAALFAGADKAEVPFEMHSVVRDVRACLNATTRAVQLARQYNTRLHICHVSTAAELSLLAPVDTPIAEKRITAEVSPHHLLFTTFDYSRLGARIKMNPAVKSTSDRLALRRALRAGIIDMVATDHAPHLLKEKAGDARTALSGAPMVQFALPVLLSLFDAETAERVYCRQPAQVFGICRRGRLEPGYYADITFVRETEPYTVTDDMVISPCGWTPLIGTTLHHRIESTLVNGIEVYNRHKPNPFTPDSDTASSSPSASAQPSMPLQFAHD